MKQESKRRRSGKPSIALSTRAKFFRGLADPARLSLLLSLRSGPCSAGELASASNLSPSNASNHLQCLLECGLVQVESNGRRNIYRLAGPQVAVLLGLSARILSTHAGTLIDACRKYGPPSRRGLRTRRRRPEGR